MKRITPRGRPLARLLWVGAGCLAAAASCSAPGKGALMLAISTDMQTPKDLDVVSVFVESGGVVKFDYLGRVLPDGTLTLPSTLAIVQPENPNTQVHIRVIAFQEQNARVLRDVLTTVPTERTALLRLPLDFLDDRSGQGTLPPQFVPDGADGAPEGLTQFDPTMITSSCDPMQLCASGAERCMTTINGACGSATVNSSQLPDYAPTDVFGDGGLLASGAPTSCFDVQGCFAGATPISNVDMATCTFPLPGTSGLPATADGGPDAAPVDATTSDEAGTATGSACTSNADCSTGQVCCSVLGGVGMACLPSDECSLGGLLSEDGSLGSTTLSAPVPLTVSTVNVALVTQSTGACLPNGQCYVPLPNDPNQGWTLQGSTVQLAPGVCMQLGSTVTVAVSTSACATETLSEPVCEPGDAGEPEAGTSPEAGLTGDGLDGAVSTGGHDAAVGAPATAVSIICVPASEQLQAGDTAQFLATVTFSDSSMTADPAGTTWASSSPLVGTVSASGLFTATSPGTTNVKASFDGLTSQACVVTVSGAPDAGSTANDGGG